MQIGRTVGAILSAIASIAAIFGLILTLHDRRETTSSAEMALTSTPAPEGKTGIPPSGGTPEVNTPEPTPEPPAPPKDRTHPPLPQPRAPEFPLEVTLRDNEETVFLSGRASVGVQFNRIGEEQFLTVRINTGTDSRSEAVLGGGARLPLQVGNTEYVVSVLGIDYSEKTAHVRVDRRGVD
jgi:hypothetical protein